MSTCEMCYKDSKADFFSQTTTYYRNKIARHYYFCSDECKTTFDNTRKCKYCGYHSDLVKMDGFMLCTSDSYWIPTPSCHDKYLSDNLLLYTILGR